MISKLTTALLFLLAASLLSAFSPESNVPAAHTTDPARHITILPYNVDFEAVAFPPTNWLVYDSDGQAPGWSANESFNHTPGGWRSAMHLFGYSNPEEDGWLVTPLVDIPAGTGTTLSFWSLNENPQWYGSNGVYVSTGSPDPDMGDYVPIWSPITVSRDWFLNLVDLSPWQGQSIYIGFRYQGYDAHNWFLDDVRIEEHIGIHDFPWLENFESGTFAPYYWWHLNEDGDGVYWSWTQDHNFSQDGTCAAVHLGGTNESGWLISPRILIPATGRHALSWRSFNENIVPGMAVNSVLLSTGSGDPLDGQFNEISYDPVPLGDDWYYNIVDLSSYAGQTIILAFHYEGFDGHDWYLDDVLIEEYQGIWGFPYMQNFEFAQFPPAFWQSFDQDSQGGSWILAHWDAYYDGGVNSASHWFEDGQPTQDGWLVSPLLRLPADGAASLSFWHKNILYGSFGSNGVWLSTASLDPLDGDYTQIWTAGTGNLEWTYETIDLAAWNGQNVYLAFRLQGANHEWYLDNVLVDVLAIDILPPVVSHRPLLNTLRDDIPYPVYAEVEDDPTWNSGISAVWLYYKINEGEWILLPMNPDGSGYLAEIPAQEHGTRIDYVIVAVDASPQANTLYTQGFTFWVDDPVWLYYDSLAQNSWAGWNQGNWGLGVIFANPLYDLGQTLKVNKVTGCFMQDDTVDLKLYSFEDLEFTNLAPLMAPQSLFFGSGGWQETTLTELLVDAPYFMVVYDGIDAWNGFAADNQRYYPGMCRMDLGDGVFQDLGDLGFNGAWMLRVQVQSTSGISAPVLTIFHSTEGPVLQWTAVPGADHYNVYASADPSLPEPWALFDSTIALELGALGDWDFNFFQVTAVAGTDGRQATSTNHAMQPEPPVPVHRSDLPRVFLKQE